MWTPLAFLLLTCALSPRAVATSDSAYPPPYGGLDDDQLSSGVPIRREVYGGGRIIDISHRYHRDMPSWESSDGVGEFVWLQKSMKNGSLANNSEMMFGTHTGTHVDAPGHVYDHYFDAGFDVDTLDLEVLNEISRGIDSVSWVTEKSDLVNGGHMRSTVYVFLVLSEVFFVPLLSFATVSSNDAYPVLYGDGSVSSFGVADANSGPLRTEVHGDGEIFDITHKYTPHTPVGDSTEGIGQFLTLFATMKNGSDYNLSEMKLKVHSGTHVDAPGHYYDNYYDEGYDVDSLDLRILNGPALLVDVPRDKNITAEAMNSLSIPKGVKRVLFRTLNTDRGLMYKKEFDTSYVGFMKDGAQWLVDNTDIKLVGVDYLSVAAFDDLIPSHLVFLKDRDIILVEGLKLDNVKAGIYAVHCLPLRLVGAEGSPIRCILIK